MPKLLVKAMPKPMESPRGFVLRLAEANHFRNTSDLLYAGGFNTSDIVSTTYPMEKLASIVNIDKRILSRMNYSQVNAAKKHEFVIYGSVIEREKRNSPWLDQEGQICPLCVSEDGHCDITNDMKFMVGCHRHGVVRLRKCTSCHKSISWNRPHLLKCGHCGFDLKKAKLKPLTQEHLVLMQVIHHKAHQIPLSRIKVTAGFPIEWFEKTSFGDMMWLLRRMLEGLDDQFERIKDDFEITQKIAWMLSSWPLNFREMVNKAMRSLDTQDMDEIVAEEIVVQKAKLSGLSLMLSKQSGACGDFFRKELLTFASNTGHYLVSRLIKGIYPFNQQYVSQTILAEQLNIDIGTVNDWVRLGLIRIKKTQLGNKNQIVIQKDSPGLQPLLPGLQFGIREAGPRIGIPPVILEKLRKMGVYEVKSMPIFMKLFHDKDLEEFKARLIKQSKFISTLPETKVVSLAHGLVHYKFGKRDGQAKAEFIAKYLTKEIQSIGRVSNHPSDIYFKEEIFREYSRCEREKTLDIPLVSRTYVARDIECNPAAISPLIEKGYLKIKGTHPQRQILKSSVEKFKEKYVSLNQIAKARNINIKKLSNYLKSRKINSLSVKLKSKHANVLFIKKSEILKINSI